MRGEFSISGLSTISSIRQSVFMKITQKSELLAGNRRLLLHGGAVAVVLALVILEFLSTAFEGKNTGKPCIENGIRV